MTTLETIAAKVYAPTKRTYWRLMRVMLAADGTAVALASSDASSQSIKGMFEKQGLEVIGTLSNDLTKEVRVKFKQGRAK